MTEGTTPPPVAQPTAPQPIAPPPVAQPMAPPPVAPKERPLGVTIIAILLIPGGLLNLAGLMGVNTYMTAGFTALGAVVAINGILGIIFLVTGIGMLGLKPWAWTLGVIIVIIAIVMVIAMIALMTAMGAALAGGAGAGMMAGLGMICGAVPLLIDIIILAYLFTGKVKAAFGV